MSISRSVRSRKRWAIFFLLTACVGTFFIVKPGFHVLPKGRVKLLQQHPGPYAGVISYCINLDRSPDRLLRVMPLLKQLNWPPQRIAGVDGLKLSQKEVNAYVDMAAFRQVRPQPPSLGEIGCYLSHVKVWRAFLQSSAAYALVFEDDADFVPPMVERVVRELVEHPQYWDICNFNGGFYHSRTRKVRGLLPVKRLSDVEVCVCRKQVCGSAGYLLNRKAALQLLHKAFPMVMTLDIYYARDWELGLKYTAVRPSIVHQSGRSVIIPTPKTAFPEKRVTSFSHFICRIKASVARFCYAFKHYCLLRLFPPARS